VAQFFLTHSVVVPYCVPNKPQKSTLYDIRSHNIDLLRYCIGTFDWSSVILSKSASQVWYTSLQH